MIQCKHSEKKLAVVTTVDVTMAGLVLAQIKAAQSRGFTVYGLCAKGSYYEYLKENGVIMYTLPFTRAITPFKDIVAIWKLYRFLKREKIDIVHTHTSKAALYGLMAAKLAGVKYSVNTAHGLSINDNTRWWLRPIFLAYERIAARLANITLTQNPEDIVTAKELKIGRPERTKLLGNGVDLEEFDPARFSDDFISNKKAEIGIPDNAVVVGIIARLVKEKGFIELFEAMQNLMPKYKNLWLVIIGPEQTERNGGFTGDSYKEYCIADKTVWLGRRDDVAELAACFDIYAFPSWREGFPRSAIEAAAMGLPIIAANIRGSRQVVEDGVNGLLIPLRDAKRLEEALERLIEDEDIRIGMGKKSYDKARRDFDENKVCEIVIGTYEQLLA